MSYQHSYTPEQEKTAEDVLTKFGPLFVKVLSKIDPFRKGTYFFEFKDLISELIYSRMIQEEESEEKAKNLIMDITKILRDLSNEIASVETNITEIQVKAKHRIPNAVKSFLTEMKETSEFLKNLREFIRSRQEGEGEVKEDESEETSRFRFLFDQIGDDIRKERGDLLEFDCYDDEEEEGSETESEEGTIEEEEESSEDDKDENEGESVEEKEEEEEQEEEEEGEEEEEEYKSNDDVTFITPRKQGTVKSSGLTGKLFKRLGLVRKTKSPSLVSPKEKKQRWWKKRKKRQEKKKKELEEEEEYEDEDEDEVKLMEEMVNEEFGELDDDDDVDDDDSKSLFNNTQQQQQQQQQVKEEEDVREVEEEGKESKKPKSRKKVVKQRVEKDEKKFRRVKKLLKKCYKEYFKEEELTKVWSGKEKKEKSRVIDSSTAVIQLTKDICSHQKAFKELGGQGSVIVKRKKKFVSDDTSIRYDTSILDEIESCILYFFNEKRMKKEPIRNMIHKPLQIIIKQNKNNPELESVYYIYNDMSLKGFRLFPNLLVKSGKTYWEYMIDIITFIEFLHNRKKQAHLDLRPTNCLYIRGYQVDEPTMKIITFGTTVNKGDCTKKLFPSYMAPEKEKSFESDVFSFGLFLLHKGTEMEISNKRYSDDYFIDPVSLFMDDLENNSESCSYGMMNLIRSLTPIDDKEKEDVEDYQRRLANVTIVVCCTEDNKKFRPTPTQIKKYMLKKKYLFGK